MWDSTSTDSATTVVLPRSHKELWEDLMADPASAELRASSGHYVEINSLRDAARRERLATAVAEGARRVPVPAGALLLWNSRYEPVPMATSTSHYCTHVFGMPQSRS